MIENDTYWLNVKKILNNKVLIVWDGDTITYTEDTQQIQITVALAFNKPNIFININLSTDIDNKTNQLSVYV